MSHKHGKRPPKAMPTWTTKEFRSGILQCKNCLGKFQGLKAFIRHEVQNGRKRERCIPSRNEDQDLYWCGLPCPMNFPMTQEGRQDFELHRNACMLHYILSQKSPPLLTDVTPGVGHYLKYALPVVLGNFHDRRLDVYTCGELGCGDMFSSNLQLQSHYDRCKSYCKLCGVQYDNEYPREAHIQHPSHMYGNAVRNFQHDRLQNQESFRQDVLSSEEYTTTITPEIIRTYFRRPSMTVPPEVATLMNSLTTFQQRPSMQTETIGGGNQEGTPTTHHDPGEGYSQTTSSTLPGNTYPTGFTTETYYTPSYSTSTQTQYPQSNPTVESSSQAVGYTSQPYPTYSPTAYSSEQPSYQQQYQGNTQYTSQYSTTSGFTAHDTRRTAEYIPQPVPEYMPTTYDLECSSLPGGTSYPPEHQDPTSYSESQSTAHPQSGQAGRRSKGKEQAHRS